MNPDENNNNQTGDNPAMSEAPAVPEAPATPEAPVAPETPETPETPVVPETPETSETPEAPATPEASVADNLDQVAAGLANAAQTEPFASEPTPEPTLQPEPTPMTESTSEPAPMTEPAPEPMAESQLEPTPEFTPATEPAPSTEPAAEPVSEPAPEPTPELATEPQPQTESAPTPSANFVGDAPAPAEAPAEKSEEEEEPLVPANPVPGSIGSALAYSETAPDHAVPVGKPIKVKKQKQPISKENLKLLIMIVGGVALIAVVAVIIFFILSNNNKSSTTKPSDSSSTTPTTPTVSSLTCTRTGDGSIYGAYGEVTSGNDQAIAMYSNDTLTSFGTTMTLVYADEDSANSGRATARELFGQKLANVGLSADPFDSSYDVSGNTLTVTHQAEGEDITASNAKAFDFYVVKGEPITDIDTLTEVYEAEDYTCVEK